MVHTYLYALQDADTRVSMVALGDGGFSGALTEAGLSLSLTKGSKVMQQIAAAIPQ